MRWLMFIAVLCLGLLSGCLHENRIAGDGWDEHGCIGSAGYSWCEEKQKCLRIWEEPCRDESLISDFDECAAAGYPVMESYPRQCRSRDDRTFIEVIKENNPIEENDSVEVSDFDTCMDAGYEILESVPRQCTTPEGRTYVEEIEGEFCGYSTGGECSTDSECTTGGCSGQVCQSTTEDPVHSDCMYRDCYDDSRYGVACRCVSDRCIWRSDSGTQELGNA